MALIFFNFPREVRDLIYGEALIMPTGLSMRHCYQGNETWRTKNKPRVLLGYEDPPESQEGEEDLPERRPVYTKEFTSPALSLLRANKQVHEEAAEALYSNVRFEFQNGDAFALLRTDIGPTNVSLVRHIKFRIPESWPPSDRQKTFKALEAYTGPLTVWIGPLDFWKGRLCLGYLDLIKHSLDKLGGGNKIDVNLLVYGNRIHIAKEEDIEVLRRARHLGFNICREATRCMSKDCENEEYCKCPWPRDPEKNYREIEYPFEFEIRES